MVDVTLGKGTVSSPLPPVSGCGCGCGWKKERDERGEGRGGRPLAARPPPSKKERKNEKKGSQPSLRLTVQHVGDHRGHAGHLFRDGELFLVGRHQLDLGAAVEGWREGWREREVREGRRLYREGGERQHRAPPSAL
jgi:hypothetical protein